MLVVASYVSTSKLSLLFLVAYTSAGYSSLRWPSLYFILRILCRCKCENARLWARIFSITVWNYATLSQRSGLLRRIKHSSQQTYTAFRRQLGSSSVCTEHVGMNLWLPGRQLLPSHLSLGWPWLAWAAGSWLAQAMGRAFSLAGMLLFSSS
ncbi:hypothetical protein GGI43DRAFT_45296 [Trichoderma evansii]